MMGAMIRDLATRLPLPLIALLVSVHAADIATTLVAVSAGGTEANPFAATVAASAGLLGLVAVKLLGTAVQLAMIAIMPAWMRWAGWTVAIGVAAVPPLINLTLITGGQS